MNAELTPAIKQDLIDLSLFPEVDPEVVERIPQGDSNEMIFNARHYFQEFKGYIFSQTFNEEQLYVLTLMTIILGYIYRDKVDVYLENTIDEIYRQELINPDLPAEYVHDHIMKLLNIGADTISPW